MSAVLGPDGRPHPGNAERSAFNFKLELSEDGRIVRLVFPSAVENLEMPSFELLRFGHALISAALAGCDRQVAIRMQQMQQTSPGVPPASPPS